MVSQKLDFKLEKVCFVWANIKSHLMKCLQDSSNVSFMFINSV
jgi:hypothetical protein